MANIQLQYDANQKYQLAAIRSVVDVFKGLPEQNVGQFTAPRQQVTLKGLEVKDSIGISNSFSNRLSNEALLRNVQAVQRENFLHRNLDVKSLEFDIEMETGTGKTYVYLRTIYELYKTYGFSKFVIIVPSKAIRSGVKKSLESTRKHLASVYPTLIVDEPRVYEDGQVNMISSFAESGNLSIMVMTVQSFNKENNLMNKPLDSMNGCRPIDVLKETRPIVIIDEPQKFMSTDNSKEALRNLAPLFVLNYSATHRERHTLLYRLGPVESYQQRLVKRIDVIGNDRSEETNNCAVLTLEKVDASKSSISAKIKCNCIDKKGKLKEKSIIVRPFDCLTETTNNDIYDGYVVRGIYSDDAGERVEFDNGVVLKRGVVQNAEDDALRRLQIRQTIQEHLRRELRLLPRGIKVLSLFFIDDVAKYVELGGGRTGAYARMFEEEYAALIQKADYRALREKWPQEPKAFHNGYFAKDSQGRDKNTKDEFNNENLSDTDKEANARAISNILDKKEQLLSVNEPLRFIFSHSALQEGWDNPNVFQICTLADTRNEVSKRQRIGRGMRLAVDQSGNRVRKDDVNVLTVIANESYKSFAEQLQKNYEEETGIKFGRVDMAAFSDLTCLDQDGNQVDISPEAAEAISDWLKENKYIDEKGDVTDTLRKAIQDESFELPEELSEFQESVEQICRQACVKLEIRDATARKKLERHDDPRKLTHFEALWEHIKQRTQYSVQIDEARFIRACVEKLSNDAAAVKRNVIRSEKAVLSVDHGGIHADVAQSASKNTEIELTYDRYPDILQELQQTTHLTRRVLADILIQSGTLGLFTSNPRGYIEWCAPIIESVLHHEEAQTANYYIIDRTYNRAMFDEPKDEYKDENLLDKSDATSTKSLFKCVRCQSENEANCVDLFERSERVLMYAKLPEEFIIPTPVTVNGYNPDWAVVCNDETGHECLYFVYESKTTNDESRRREEENDKIRCAERHFAVASNSVKFFAGSLHDAERYFL